MPSLNEINSAVTNLTVLGNEVRPSISSEIKRNVEIVKAGIEELLTHGTPEYEVLLPIVKSIHAQVQQRDTFSDGVDSSRPCATYPSDSQVPSGAPEQSDSQVLPSRCPGYHVSIETPPVEERT